MLFNETFFKNFQKPNNLLYIRQAGKVNQDKSYTISRSSSLTNVIGCVQEGILHIKIDKKEFLIDQGSSFLLLHDSEYTIFSDTDDPPILYWCNIRGIMFDRIVDTMSFKNFTFSLADLSIFFKNVENSIKQNHDKTYDIFKLVFSALCDLKEKEAKLTVENFTQENSLAKNFEVYISNHIQDSFSVKKMAEEFSVSIDTVNRIFKSSYSVTPYQFYQNMRIDIAKTMLENSDMTIEDIAQRLNYTDRNYFSLMFKKSTSFSPAYFRKKIINRNAKLN